MSKPKGKNLLFNWMEMDGGQKLVFGARNNSGNILLLRVPGWVCSGGLAAQRAKMQVWHFVLSQSSSRSAGELGELQAGWKGFPSHPLSGKGFSSHPLSGKGFPSHPLCDGCSTCWAELRGCC